LVVLEQLEEQRQQMLDRRLSAEQRSETGDLASESGLDVRRGIGSEVSHAGEESGKDNVSVDELGEACMRVGFEVSFVSKQGWKTEGGREGMGEEDRPGI
jgi:hypothetical protein